MTISGASGVWWFQQSYPTGPYGQPNVDWDKWITGANTGQLIGFVGTGMSGLNGFPRVVSQNDSRLFVIGTGTIVRTGVEGSLWLGMNDDYTSNNVDDNSGSITVQVEGGTFVGPPQPPTVIPEPTTFALWGTLAGLGLTASRRRRRTM